MLTLVGHPEVIAEPWFATGHGRAAHVELLDGYVGDWIAARDRSDVLAAFEEAGAAIAPVYNARDLTEDPHVRETQMLTEVPDDDLGDLLQHNVMWRMQRSPGRIRFTGRDHGADTDEVLAELGFDHRQISEMRESEAVK